MPRRALAALLAALLAVPLPTSAPRAQALRTAEPVPIPSDIARSLPALAPNGMVASQEARATQG